MSTSAGSFPHSIILDFDGVILDSSGIKTDVFIEFFSRFPAVFDQMKDFHFSHKGTSRYEQFRHLCLLLNIEASQDQVNTFADEFSKLVLERLGSCSFIPGAVDFLEDLYQRVPLHIASNAPHHELKHVIAERSLEKYFRSIKGSTGTRSKRDILAEIIETNKYNKPDTLYVGDTLKDYELSEEFGLMFIGMKNQLATFPLEVTSLGNMAEAKDFLHNLCKKHGNG